MSDNGSVHDAGTTAPRPRQRGRAMTTYLDVALHRRYGDAAKRYGHRKQSQTVRLVERFVLAAERVATGTATDEDRAFIREVESAPGIEC